MTNHLTARLAWHVDGWNGRICEKPECTPIALAHTSIRAMSSPVSAI